ncbi:hypothetical protein C8Q76DRAFT_307396 [Earliella scabrosa]|nr:hypothetical protein C8Q76DRAFT_307396 [Earliella scabrosa]
MRGVDLSVVFVYSRLSVYWFAFSRVWSAQAGSSRAWAATGVRLVPAPVTCRLLHCCTCCFSLQASLNSDTIFLGGRFTELGGDSSGKWHPPVHL